MPGGGIRRRCRCRDEAGKDLGAKCPKLARRGHGKWEVRQELPATTDGQRRTFRRLGYDTQDKAQEGLDAVRALLALAKAEDDEEAVASLLAALPPKDAIPDVETVRRKLRAGQDLVEKITVGEWLDRWLAQESHKPATEASYESHVRLYLKPLIGHVRLDRLTVGHLVEMFNAIDDGNEKIEANNEDRRALLRQIREKSKRAEKRVLREQLHNLSPFRRPVGPSSRQRIRATLRAAINDAIVQQLTTFNPAQHVELATNNPKPIIWTDERVEEWQRTGQRPGPVMVWTPTQAGAFLDYVADNDQRYEAMWHLLVKRGPRRGEVAGLPRTETSVKAQTVKIVTQLTEVKYQVVEGPPKSDAGDRTIPLDAETTELIRIHLLRQDEERLRLGPAWVDSGRVFIKPDGSPLRPSWIGDQFVKHYTNAGLPPIRLHDLRHTAATLMLAAGNDMKVIQETLGHSQLQTTSDLYTSVLPELARAAAESTAAILPRAPRRTVGHPSGTHDAAEAATRTTNC